MTEHVIWIRGKKYRITKGMKKLEVFQFIEWLNIRLHMHEMDVGDKNKIGKEVAISSVINELVERGHIIREEQHEQE